MPTLSQLFKMWEVEREFGVGAAHGFGSEHENHVPSKTNLSDMTFTGKEIGQMTLDAETNDLKIVANPDNKKAPV